MDFVEINYIQFEDIVWTLYMDILQTFCGPGFVRFLWTFWWDFVFWRFHPGLILLISYGPWRIFYKRYLPYLINIICTSFVHISLIFIAILFQYTRGFYGHFMFSILLRFFP